MSTSEKKKRSAAISGAGSGLGRDVALGLAALVGNSLGRLISKGTF